MIQPGTVTSGIAALAVAWLATWWGCGQRPTTRPLTMVVMDPRARELACACVEGYAQRDYTALAQWLERRLRMRIKIRYAETLEEARMQSATAPLGLIIGRESQVLHETGQAGLSVRPLCRLTDETGRTTLTGWFVVRADDPAQSLADLRDRRIWFGPFACHEKHSAALTALFDHGVSLLETPEVRATCLEAAQAVLEHAESPGGAAVISSYALRLLEGCEQIERGALRVVGETRPVPFITVFATSALAPDMAARVQEALRAVARDARLLGLLESKNGFVPWVGVDWPDWRGAGRDGHVAWLPAALPAPLPVRWEHPLRAPALAGVAATEDVVVVADRDLLDQHDVFHGLRAADGRVLWTFEYPAAGELDYGQSPRATPVICQDKVYLLGALGDLHCVTLTNGAPLWHCHLVHDLQGRLPTWGYCSTPLVVDDLLIVNPGGAEASLVALNRHTGAVVWKTPGEPAAYASFIVGWLGHRRQIVGYDATSLGGWDVLTGRRLWTLRPPRSGDFNVPTPLALAGDLLVATENNGARLYGFTRQGQIRPKPVARCEDLAPETCSPVALNGFVFGTASRLMALDGALTPRWSSDETALSGHAALVATESRLLVMGLHGEVLLLDTTHGQVEVVARAQLELEGSELYAHPAVTGGRLYVRLANRLVCLGLD